MYVYLFSSHYRLAMFSYLFVIYICNNPIKSGTASNIQYYTKVDHKLVTNEVDPKISNIAFGVGYSSDSQQVAPQICYNASISSTSAQQGYVQLDTAIYFSELETKLGISVSMSGTYAMFSAEAKANYLRSVQDKDYTTSLNYYVVATNNVAVQLAGYGDKALTETGKGFYNNGKNPYFGIICGDNYITSYEQGALLTMGLNIKFSSSKVKNEFDEKAGASFGNIFSASESVKNIVIQYGITGSIIIQAFQMGGDPSQLSKILNKDKTGQYYALTCSLIAMDNCIKTASGLLDYAKESFSNQISFENNKGLTPLGIAFTQYIPIDYIGLIPPVSLVTKEVVQHRDEFSCRLKKNEYYKEKLYPFFNKGYPVKLDDIFINKAQSILSKANNNVRILMQTHEGAADCFNFPDKCKSIKANIDSKLQNITKSNLKFLEDLKYTITTDGLMFYNTGGGLATSWAPNPLIEVIRVYVTDKLYFYDTFRGVILYISYVGKSIDNGMTYVGTLCSQLADSKHCKPGVQETKKLSPFFFEPYNNTKWCD